MSMRLKLALRDLAIGAVTLALWSTDAAAGQGPATAASMALAAGAGLLTAVCGYLVHEWGHLAGAVLSRSVVHHPTTPIAVFLFQFDSDRNSRGQFLAMSFGGFIASAIVVALLITLLPTDALAGRLALFLTLLGVAATVILEFPPAWRVARGAPLPTGVAYHSASEGSSGNRAAA